MKHHRHRYCGCTKLYHYGAPEGQPNQCGPVRELLDSHAFRVSPYRYALQASEELRKIGSGLPVLLKQRQRRRSQVFREPE